MFNRSNFQEWYSVYEKLTDMIVPRSTQLIIQDGEYGMFTVTLFKKIIDEFKLCAREKKFIVREFTYNEEELAAGECMNLEQYYIIYFLSKKHFLLLNNWIFQFLQVKTK